MSNVNWEWISWLFNFLAILAVILLVTLAAIKQKSKLQEFYLKKICWGILIVSVIYFYVTIPFIGSYYDFSDKLKYSTTKTAEEQENYLKDHHYRIERLEDELKETKEELKAIRKHYEFGVQVVFYAILYFGIYQILKKKDGSFIGESEKDSD